AGRGRGASASVPLEALRGRTVFVGGDGGRRARVHSDRWHTIQGVYCRQSGSRASAHPGAGGWTPHSRGRSHDQAADPTVIFGRRKSSTKFFSTASGVRP